jgi:hypothetical protein
VTNQSRRRGVLEPTHTQREKEREREKESERERERDREGDTETETGTETDTDTRRCTEKLVDSSTDTDPDRLPPFSASSPPKLYGQRPPEETSWRTSAARLAKVIGDMRGWRR